MKHSFVSSLRPYYTRFVSRLLPQIHHLYTKSLKKKRQCVFHFNTEEKIPRPHVLSRLYFVYIHAVSFL